MNTEKAQAARPEKLPPARVRECLSRDVHAILSVCIHQFKENGEDELDCFDVDAVISGKGVKPKIRYESRVQPASWAKAPLPTGTNRPYTAAARGSFIPRHA